MLSRHAGHRLADCVHGAENASKAVGGQGIVLDAEPEEISLDVGAVVMATGFDLYEPASGMNMVTVFCPAFSRLPQLIRCWTRQAPHKARSSGTASRCGTYVLSIASAADKWRGSMSPTPTVG